MGARRILVYLTYSYTRSLATIAEGENESALCCPRRVGTVWRSGAGQPVLPEPA